MNLYGDINESFREGVRMARQDITYVLIRFFLIFLIMNTQLGAIALSTIRNYIGYRPSLQNGVLDVPYAVSLQTVAIREGMNPLIMIAIIEIESGWDPNSVSESGAEGLMQTMPFIQRAYDCGNVFIPSEGISCGGAYLGDLLRKYGTAPGEIELAIAAYHAGEPLVDACDCVPREIDKEYVRRWKEAYAAHSTRSSTTYNNASKIKSGKFVFPYKAPYMFTNSSPHLGGWGAATHGIDIAIWPKGPDGTTYAPIDGKVTYIGYDSVGNTVIHIENNQCEVALLHGRYAGHTQVGQTVFAGITPIGLEASIGNSTGPHTHLSYACNGKVINPFYLTLDQN